VVIYLDLAAVTPVCLGEEILVDPEAVFGQTLVVMVRDNLLAGPDCLYVRDVMPAAGTEGVSARICGVAGRWRH